MTHEEENVWKQFPPCQYAFQEVLHDRDNDSGFVGHSPEVPLNLGLKNIAMDVNHCKHRRKMYNNTNSMIAIGLLTMYKEIPLAKGAWRLNTSFIYTHYSRFLTARYLYSKTGFHLESQPLDHLQADELVWLLKTYLGFGKN